MTRMDDIFAERARVLAEPEERAALHGRTLDLVAFEAGSQKVAIEAQYVHAVVGRAGSTPVPGAPDILVGVINFRGSILPVFDISRALGGTGAMDGDCTIVLGEHGPEFAFVANAVEEVSGVEAAQLHAALQTENGTMPPSLGVTRSALNVLDGRALLADRKFYVGGRSAGHT